MKMRVKRKTKNQIQKMISSRELKNKKMNKILGMTVKLIKKEIKVAL
jgi:hypothetical protein